MSEKESEARIVELTVMREIKELSNSVVALSVNVAAQTSEMKAHKNLSEVMMSRITSDHVELKSAVLANTNNIEMLKTIQAKQIGAASLLEKLWPFVWGVAGAVIMLLGMVWVK